MADVLGEVGHLTVIKGTVATSPINQLVDFNSSPISINGRYGSQTEGRYFIKLIIILN